MSNDKSKDKSVFDKRWKGSVLNDERSLTHTLHGAVDCAVPVRAAGVAASSVRIHALLTFGAKSLTEALLAVVNFTFYREEEGVDKEGGISSEEI